MHRIVEQGKQKMPQRPFLLQLKKYCRCIWPSFLNEFINDLLTQKLFFVLQRTLVTVDIWDLQYHSRGTGSLSRFLDMIIKMEQPISLEANLFFSQCSDYKSKITGQ